MKFLHNLAIAACLLVATAFAQAETYTYSGDTTGGHTFHRPLSFSSLSAVGTNVAYHEFDFSVATSGVYTFSSATASYDGYSFLYSTFNPASPLSNLLALNDDAGTGDYRHSRFAVSLTAGTKYEFINASFENGTFGAFNAEISGPGAVITAAVPEPETYAMLLAGLGLMGVVARRRKQA